MQVVHYCQNYRQGEWLFAKRRVPKGERLTWPPPSDSILGCAHPLLAVSPLDLRDVLEYRHNDGGTKPLRPQQAHRVNFVLRAATDGVNAAIGRFKQDVCPSHGQVANMDRSYRLVPEHVARKAEHEAKKMASHLAKPRPKQHES